MPRAGIATKKLVSQSHEILAQLLTTSPSFKNKIFNEIGFTSARYPDLRLNLPVQTFGPQLD